MKIFVRNIHPDVEEYKLAQIFEEFGIIHNCYECVNY